MTAVSKIQAVSETAAVSEMAAVLKTEAGDGGCVYDGRLVQESTCIQDGSCLQHGSCFRKGGLDHGSCVQDGSYVEDNSCAFNTHTFTCNVLHVRLNGYLHPVPALTFHVLIMHLETIFGNTETLAAPPNHVRIWTSCLNVCLNCSCTCILLSM
jgi:hypothetical protein